MGRTNHLLFAELWPGAWQALSAGMVFVSHDVDSLRLLPKNMRHSVKKSAWYSSARGSAVRECVGLGRGF